jgi:IMP dehydrogenase
MRGISRRLEERVYNYEGITFDDVLMLPSFSKIDKESANLDFEFKGILFRLPIISSPMDTVTGFAMAIEMSINGGLGILHNNLPIEDKIKFINNIKDFNLTQEAYKTCSYLIKSKTLPAACAVGIGKYDDIKRIMLETDVDILCVDTAHGLTDKVIETIRYIKKLNRDFGKNALIMAGNVATEEATALAYEGVDFLRVGIGSGQICTTRIVMGIGVPQLTAIDMVKTSLINTEFSEKVMIISDGGIKQLGDINKALAFGADFVMLGSLLSCYEESKGINDGKLGSGDTSVLGPSTSKILR